MENARSEKVDSIALNIAPNGLKVYLETYGCQMNEYDTELVRAILIKTGFTEVDCAEKADVVLLNTCSVRENAHNRVLGRLQILDQMREDRELTVGVLGCMAQSLKMDLLEMNVTIEIIAGPDSYRNLPRMIIESRESGHLETSFDLSEFETYDDIYPIRKEGVNAWIAVMRGCDNFCTFCAVPYARGRERSRSIESIVDETKALVNEGFTQVTLLGQNVNSYGHDGRKFDELIGAVAEIPEIRRVRFISPHPKDFPDELLQVMKSHPQICKHIHLPLQAGSDRVLKMMNRKYTAVEFRALVSKICEILPEIVLTTDIITGFPTETREEFEETVKILREIKFDSAFIFNYSERQNTVAKRRWPDDVPADEKKYRIVLLNEIQEKISLERNKRHIGQIHEILIEGPSRKRSSEWAGRTDGNKTVIFPHSSEKIGDYINVKISDATANTLKGTRE